MKICPTCFERYRDFETSCPVDEVRLLTLGTGDARCGTVIAGRFLLLERLAEGGMGQVYRALQFSVRREVAVKLLPARLARRGELVRRFIREARVLAALRSPHIVSCIDFGDLASGEYYIAMELLEGDPLSEVIEKNGPLPLERVVDVLRQICRALEVVHARGFVHRDLKPGNIIIEHRRGEDQVRLIDFGLVSCTDDESGRLTFMGEMIGSPAYVSPEQVTGKAVGATSDIYSLGAMAFHMASGRLPFASHRLLHLLSMHVQDEAPRLAPHVPDEPGYRTLGAIVARCLSKKQTKRYRSARQLRAALGRVNTRGVWPDTAVIAPRASWTSVAPRPAPPVPTLAAPAVPALAEAMLDVVLEAPPEPAPEPEPTEWLASGLPPRRADGSGAGSRRRLSPAGLAKLGVVAALSFFATWSCLGFVAPPLGGLAVRARVEGVAQAACSSAGSWVAETRTSAVGRAPTKGRISPLSQATSWAEALVPSAQVTHAKVRAGNTLAVHSGSANPGAHVPVFTSLAPFGNDTAPGRWVCPRRTTFAPVVRAM